MEKVKAEAKAEPVKEIKKEKDTTGLIEIGDFGKVDIRVADILEASGVEGSDKLLYLKVNSGLDERFIVAGIAQAYSPEDIKGKKILLVQT
jgi:methionyl-tRNA synthetase